MVFQFDTLDQDTKTFIDPAKTLGDIGVVLTKADIEKANAEEAEAETEEPSGEGEEVTEEEA